MQEDVTYLAGNLHTAASPDILKEGGFFIRDSPERVMRRHRPAADVLVLTRLSPACGDDTQPGACPQSGDCEMNGRRGEGGKQVVNKNQITCYRP